ncbi:MAG: hypothetical protein WC878_07665 [Candidatus Paceibacterota bacterium]|jgi:hypothetical protein
MFQKFKDLLLCIALGFATTIFLTASLLGGDEAVFFGFVVPILIIFTVCGAWEKRPKYIHFINIVAYFFPIVFLIGDMNRNLAILLVIVGAGAFLCGIGLRFTVDAISFYLSTKKNS